ncbi:MAG TPA: hypothetical protein VLM79_28760 [Kofleriaceae bacterium]|nr:hypothetical protein [Kofleriaceae bacterium]
MTSSTDSTRPPHGLRRLQYDICDRVRDFEIGPLLDLLASMGYGLDDIWFRGHMTDAPQPTLLHDIAFASLGGTIAGPPACERAIDLGSADDVVAIAPAANGPRARSVQPPVTITVNLGLLSCRSPLPSYFQRLLRDPTYHEPLVELLQLLDHHLLRARLSSDRPERLVARWGDVTSDLLRIHGLDSLIGLSWLFRHVFPELPLTVMRTSEELAMPHAPARLGSELGRVCLGPVTWIDVHDFQITLRCEDSLLRPGTSWLHEVERRLRDTVFPALDAVCMNLTVILEIADQHADAAGFRPGSYIGMDPLERVESGAPYRVIVARGLRPRQTDPGQRHYLFTTRY